MGAQVYNRTMVERLHYSPAPVPAKSYKRQSPALNRVNSAKRNLFGAVEREEFNQFYNMHMKQQDEKKMQKWNFDFRKGEPLEGQLKWVRAHQRSVFTLTHTAHVRPTVSRRSTTADVPPSSSSGDILSPDELMDELAERANRGNSVPKLRQPKITDFLKERKRCLSSAVAVEKISAKKVRLMMAASSSSSSSSSSSGGAQQQAQEASTSSSAN
ncbi:cyclin-dependent kinase inhibitor 1 [Anopheles stephensi]|uniref:cyclin-dependent kinase inhibitor 1 n=1 Tax=Anopheles stephensi TaxID=30069 RepID=UPI001658B041|nr:cyclin-dependent kinase inhibitor 1 [Anopheles stephensi]